MQGSFTSQDVVRLTGITARQLQWWDERGIVVPARQGHRRVYSFEDLTEVAVICELRRKGFSLQRMRKVVRFLQKEFSKRLAETVGSSSNYHLLSDGRSLYLETSPQQIVDILKNSRQPMFAPGQSCGQRTQAARPLRSRKSPSQGEVEFLACVRP
jgi:DNA-binding transcriptional MerR regulator